MRKSDDAGAALHGGSAAENAVSAANVEAVPPNEASGAEEPAWQEAAAASKRIRRRAHALVLVAIAARDGLKRCHSLKVYTLAVVAALKTDGVKSSSRSLSLSLFLERTATVFR
jgi:hypothetical protein